MSKINNDKYYTPIDLANYCIDRCIEVIGLDNIKDVIEPSCGNGSFFHHSILKPSFGYDILPEIEGDNIIKCDFLTYYIPYKVGRLVIGNPPYGERNDLSRKFMVRASEISDFVAFILPISQLDSPINNMYLELIYSEDLGKRVYSDRTIHCCFNIYKRTDTIQKMVSSIDDLTILREDQNSYNDFEFDIRMCRWGSGTVGKILYDESEHYASEYKIKIHNKKLYDKIYDVIISTNWKEIAKSSAMGSLKKWQIIRELLQKIPELNNKMGNEEFLTENFSLW